MALYPGARHRLIAAGANDPPIIVIGAILHVDAGNSKSLYGYFNGPSGGIESHFHVPKELQVEQYRDTGREADANLKANSFIKNGKRYGFISIETQGFGAGEWNAHQLAEIKDLLVWLSKTHNFPLRRCPGPFEAGVGYHVMFGAPGPWTPVSKSCPGPDRVKQFNNILVPWFKTAGTPTTPPKPPVQETDMPLTDAEIQKIADRVLDTPVRADGLTLRKVLPAVDWLTDEHAVGGKFEKVHASWAPGGDLNNQLDRIEADTDVPKAP